MTVKNWHPNIINFVCHVRDHTSSRNVRLFFSPHHLLKDKEHAKGIYGYFLEPDRTGPGRIVVAAKVPLPTLLHTLAHEYAHFLQWERKMACYVKDHYIAQERNAEINAIKLLEMYELPIDMEVRRKRSAQYLRKLHRV